MSTIAIIGGDGAGKTTIINSLLQSPPLPLKYLYMGLSTQSSNRALPTSRLVLFLKQRFYRNKVQKSDAARSDHIPSRYNEYSLVKRGPIWSTARLINRLAEAYYRQLVSVSYQLRGYVVLYDRYFLFDAAPYVVNSQVQKQSPLDRLYYLILSQLYPKPTLSIFLNAPGEVLYARKKEATPEYLNRQRGAYLEQGKKMENFVQVDATQPLDKVLEEVTQQIKEFYESKYHQRSDSAV
jgi:thymidylate kinase